MAAGSTLSAPANTLCSPAARPAPPPATTPPRLPPAEQVDADTVKGVANRFILDQDIAIAAMGDTQMLPGGCWPPAGP